MQESRNVLPANRFISTNLDTEQKIRKFAFLPAEELFHSFASSTSGLELSEAERRLKKYGKNEITSGKENTVFHRLRAAIVNPFNVILFVIAIVTYVTDVVISQKADYLTVNIILILIFVSSMVAFIQAERSHSATEKLSHLIINTADVLRDGAFVNIPMEEVVPGDIVQLSAGDMLPADLRFLTTKDTFISQAALTGESNPVEKFCKIPEDKNSPLTDLQNIGFMGSDMISGSATALALTTGNNTYFGSMATSLTGDQAKTSFERGVNSVSRLLIRMMVVMLLIVFLINGLIKQDWSSSLLFAISIAVGLTPEMLPVIMTSTLAKGAVSMSKHQVIVRTLGAIQTFGEMDVLCTDKTGTLTEDRIVLEKYLNLRGEDDQRILRHAYLNSHFQTGLKNLIDLAIIKRAEHYGFEKNLTRYHRVDEIPFDFERRRMSVVLEDKTGKRQLITKGAVEEIMEITSLVEIDGVVSEIDEDLRQKTHDLYQKYNSAGLRMLAVAQKNDVPDSNTFSVADERNMVLIGFIGFLDPPKESARGAITALKEHGVRTVVLTGDSEGVAINVCDKVGVSTEQVLTGRDVELMDDSSLLLAVQTCDLFAKLSPYQKERVVGAFQARGHTVGYLGDGINDAPSLRKADVGISVDSAVDISKETADIILLKKDLLVLEEGVIEGRHTFGNMIKYIKLATSGNFGNIISVIVASIFLPFLPMLPVQILTQNLLCDFSQMGIPFDKIDSEYLKKPHKWDIGAILSFMTVFGPLSSIFDILCFAILWFAIGANRIEYAPLFHSGWFVYGTISQVLIIHVIRTAKIPFVQSKPAFILALTTFVIAVIALMIGFTELAIGLDMTPLSTQFVPWLALILLAYGFCAQFIKVIYIKHYGEWI
ncbi:MAG: magnesium-translocating P-type ATPase [Chloroflexi bacterium]|nr:magnesium-translocating P-type ATPase [Chloroflexota bacterium]